MEQLSSDMEYQEQIKNTSRYNGEETKYNSLAAKGTSKRDITISY
ncbi:MAG TPA: hypothetical protein VJ729_07070 [Nitrososphaeraceae archaeon]|nr:hypothetical protein [Nitrososphaeraceae archaeon]